MPDLSDGQVQQVVAWTAAGGTPRSILTAVTDQNRDDTGLAPWPAELTEQDLDVVIEEHEGQRLALYGQRLLTRTAFGSLAGRASQASAAVDRLNDIDRQICVCSEQFDRLLRAGAYDTRPPSEESQGEANILLRRATELGRHVVALRMVRIKEAEVLAKVTGHVGNRDPMPEATLGFE